MTKTAGGQGLERLLVDGINLSGNIGALQSIRASRALLDYTDITQAAIERKAGLQQGQMQFNAWWDGTPSTGVNETLKTMRQNGIVCYSNGVALLSPCACLVADESDYAIPRSPEGTLAATATFDSDTYPLEWGYLATAGSGQPWQTFGAAGNGSDCDDLGGSPTSTTNGAALYVQLLAFTGTSVTVKVQDAATLPTYADVSGLTTGALTAIGAARAASSASATIRRYTRIVLSGTFSNAVLLAAIVRGPNQTQA